MRCFRRLLCAIGLHKWINGEKVEWKTAFGALYFTDDVCQGCWKYRVDPEKMGEGLPGGYEIIKGGKRDELV